MDESQSRPSGASRLSRLPVPKATPSAIPRPVSTAAARPVSTTPSRSTPSRQSAGGELRNPRLRPAASRDQLRSNVGGDTRTQRLRTSLSRDKLQATPAATPSKPKAQPPLTTLRAPRAAVTPRKPSIAEESTPAHELDPALESQDPAADEYLFKRRLTLTQRPSEGFGSSDTQDAVKDVHEDPNAIPAASTAQTAPSEDVKPRSSKPRQSLSERTMETLAQIPSSPAIKKKSSAFFDQGRPASRPGSSTSRPGSSYNSDGSGRPSSRAASRPGSSGDREETAASLRGPAANYKTPLSTIDGTPQSGAAGAGSSTTPSHMATPSRMSIAASRVSASVPSSSDPRTPSPEKKTYGMLPPKSTSKTVTARPLKAKKSTNGLVKKPSTQRIKPSVADSDASRQASVTSGQSSSGSWDGTVPSIASTAPGEDPEPSALASSRKSSAALRDQIAKARAAQRAAIKKTPSAQPSLPEAEAPIIPSDDGFDFGMGDDPFNARKGENPGAKVLTQRVAAARTTGRLNIAALNLKEIPAEVANMYDLSSVNASGGNWAESVDLTRLVAADNEFETLSDVQFPDAAPGSFADDEESQGSIFGGLETIDLHGNLLVGLPLGFRQLNFLTSLNLSSNRLSNDSLETISQMTALRNLKLANNLLFGPLNAEFANLAALEILDLHGNNVSALPTKVENMSRLRVLNLSDNSFESLPFDGLAKLPLSELLLKKNKLSGTLIEEPVETLTHLQTLDASLNQLTRLVPLGSGIMLPVLHSLSLSMNRLQGLPDMTSWSSLLTLTVDENSISSIPNSFTSLEKLRHADFSGNDIRVVPPEIARMDNLSMIRLSGNPLRDKKFVSCTTEELKEILAGRLEPPPPYNEPAGQPGIADMLGDTKPLSLNTAGLIPPTGNGDDDSRSDVDDDFETPPTSALNSPSRSRSHTVSSMRSRSQTLSNQLWPVKQGQLDRSRTESSSLHPVVCSKVAAEHQVRQVLLHHNLFTTFPDSLSFFAETLTTLSLANNQLVAEAYLTEPLELPALRELNLGSNRMTGLGPLTKFLRAPSLEKMDISLNRINALPPNLRAAFPALSILLAANNHIIELEPESISGLKIVDASNNDISFLNPKLGLLGGPGGLERLEVMGNRFRVPRWNVLERGTEATLRWLRGRVPVAEMAAWKGDDGGADDVD